jgi:hypothetical protein
MLDNRAIQFRAVKSKTADFEPARAASAGLAIRQPSRVARTNRSLRHAQPPPQATSPCEGPTMSFDNRRKRCYPSLPRVDSAVPARINLPLEFWELPLRME